MENGPFEDVFPIENGGFSSVQIQYLDVSKNSGTPKSSMLIGFSTTNHPFRGTPILETPICINSNYPDCLFGHHFPLTSVDAKDLSSCCSYGSHAVGEGYAQLGRGFPGGGSVAGFINAVSWFP